MQKIINLIALLFSATLLITGDSHSYIPTILGVIALLSLPTTFTLKIDNKIKKIIYAFLFYFCLTLASLLVYGGHLSQADMPSRVLLGIFALFLLLKYPPKINWLLSGIIIGSYIAGFIALYFYFILQTRAFFEHGYMIIQSGNIAMSLGIFSLLTACYYLQIQKKKYALIALIAAGLGILASILSGARGGWVISPFVILSILYFNRDLLNKKMQVAALLILIGLSISAYPLMQHRISAAQSELQNYTGNQVQTSSGIRLELWKSGLYSLADSPIFGQGYNGVKIAREAQVAEGKVDPIILNFGRLHNNYLDEASTKGFLGLIALLSIFLFPLYYFFQNYRQKTTPEKNIISQLGMAHIVLVMGYCLTQNYINHHSGMLQFIVYTIILIAMSFAQSSKAIIK